jgi:hypothetical protein
MPKTMDNNEAHELRGHKSKALLIKTAKYFKVTLMGRLVQREGCFIAMAKQKAVNKQISWDAKGLYKKTFVDVSGLHPETMGGNKYWFQAVDNFLCFGWCKFAKKKRSAGHEVQSLRCDGAGGMINPSRHYV